MNNTNLKPKYDAIVIGSGMGGLLSAAFHANKGYSTCVLERLSFYGGKFTAFTYKDFEVPTGAFHMIPGAEKGGMGRCFAQLGLNIEYCYPKSGAVVVLDNKKRYPIHYSPVKNFITRSFVWNFNLKEIFSFMKLTYFFYKKDDNIPDIKFEDLLKDITSSKKVEKAIDQMLIFLNGTNVKNASIKEFKESLISSGYNKEALVKGGCRHLIQELIKCIERNGGELFNKTAVSKILLNGNRVKGVQLEDGTEINSNIVVSNAGPKRTRKFLGSNTPGWFISKEEKFRPSLGISYSIATDKPLLKHDTVEVPVDYDYICGYLQVSNLDPALAPPGKHYLLAAQMVLDPEINMADAIRKGTNDLLTIFPQITRENIFNISTFHKDWAATPTGQLFGQTGPDRYPVKVDPYENLFMISHDSQGWGFAADIIGYAALKFQQMI